MQHTDHLIPEQQITFSWIPLSFLLPLTLLKYQRQGIQSPHSPPVSEWCWEESQDGDCDREGGPSEGTDSGSSPAPGHVVEVSEGGPCHRNSKLPTGWQTHSDVMRISQFCSVCEVYMKVAGRLEPDDLPTKPFCDSTGYQTTGFFFPISTTLWWSRISCQVLLTRISWWYQNAESYLLRVQTCQLGQQEAAAFCNCLFCGCSCQMTLKCKNLLFFSLGDLKFTINHLCACLLIRQGTLRIGIVTEKISLEKGNGYLVLFKIHKPQSERTQDPCSDRQCRKKQVVSQWSQETETSASTAVIPLPLFLSFIPLLIIFLLREGTFPTPTAVLAPVYFTQVPLERRSRMAQT